MVGIVSATVSLAIIFGLSHYMSFSTYVLNVPTTMGIAIGIDYSLLLVTRFKEEKENKSIHASLLQMIHLSGRSIFVSGLIVILGLCTGCFFDSSVIRSVMLGGSIVIFITMLCSLTLLPACLSLLWNRIDYGKLFAGKRIQRSAWKSFSNLVMRYSKIAIIGAVVLLSFMIYPIKHVAFEAPGVESLPKSYDSRAAMEELYDHFSKSAFFPVTILVKKDSTNTEQQDLTGYASWIRSLPNVRSVSNDMTDLKYSIYSVQLGVDPNDHLANEVIKSIREHALAGYQVYVTGLLASHTDFDQHKMDRLPAALVYIVITTFVLLMLTFRSVMIPLKAILMNILSLSASFGILTWIFVDGHFLSFFRVEAASPIDSFVPVFIFGFLFGTSMDYEVFMLARIKEEYQTGLSNDKATAKGLSVTARMITYVALVLIIHMSAFSITEVLPVKQIGVGLAIAIFIDSTVIRLILVPALMRTLGDWNWKLPRFIDKSLPKIEV